MMYPICRIYTFSFLTLAVFAQTAFGQTSISTNSILATAKTQTAIALQERKIDVLNALSYKLPFVERIDFQTESDRFQLQRQEVRSRLSFNGWDEIKSLKQRKEANKNLQEAELTVLFKDVLFDRYALLVEYRFAQTALTKHRQLHEVFSEKRDVLQKMAKLTTNFNIEDLIKAEDAAFDYQQKMLQTEGTIRNIQQFFAFTLNSTDLLRVDTAGWIPLSILRRLVTELPAKSDKNPDLARQSATIGLAQADYNFEKAQSKKIIDYAQIKNSARGNKDIVLREWSVGMGFTIPYRGSSKIQLNDLALNRLDEENKLKNLQTNLDVQIFAIRQDLDLIFKEYDFVQKQMTESQTLYSLDHYSKIQGSSPIVLLRMRELVLGRESRLISLEHIAYQKYIKLLDLTGKLAEMPLVNYLSTGLTGF